MKTKGRFFTLTLAGLSFLACGLFAFEGKITMRAIDLAGDAEPRNVTLHAKGELLRLEPAAQNPKDKRAVTIIDHSQRKKTVLMPGRKAYTIKWFHGQVAEQMAVDFSQTQFKAAGVTEEIAGIDAEKYTGTAQDEKYTELWVTKSLGKFLLDYPGMGEVDAVGSNIEQAAWSKFAYSQDFFVLRAVEYDRKGGAEKSRFEVTEITRAKQQDSLFKIPEGYKEIDAPEGRNKQPR
ncbi:hypothetical protein M2447_001337 [Ereboglobus sp. PH5-10]|uniref:DUF4412 domain-containing protein n=1 Tax=unclassified Ereboglobus TaxID=2626932 RepID=UPI002406085A|nr:MULTISPECIES: DUF4412 domain-containing protein [unclassified Ereboglobus]MDF9827245.1 hypothetical protein [Ereboglobus sp. PH5-10]